MSSDSDESNNADAGPQNKRKRKPRCLEDSPSSSSSSGSPIIGPSSMIRRRKQILKDRNPIDSSDSDSDSGSSIYKYRQRKIARVTSDTDSDDSGSTVVRKVCKTGRISESNESGMSDLGFEESSGGQWETDCSDTELTSNKAKIQQEQCDSDISDGQSEKCPICLLSFKTQEIGTPESCDHVFCLECIQEWSKNMNTCPVDRQEFNLILVRKKMDGKIIKQVQVEKATPQNEVDIVEDPTFCEICGLSDNEDRMLLCDSCDFGFHLYCLTPPLEEVPVGSWICEYCFGNQGNMNIFMIERLIEDDQRRDNPQRQRRNQSSRLVPRTRQSERVRQRIATTRHQRSFTPTDVPPAIPSASISDSGFSSQRQRTTKPKKGKSKKRRRKKVLYKIVYEIDKVTGETVPVRKRKKKSYGRRKKRSRPERSAKPSTVKKRLAAQLKICTPRSVSQMLPDVRIPDPNSGSLGIKRYEAGIPTLHLFGRNNELDYFSGGTDEEYGDGPSQVLVSRAPNLQDITNLRRARRKQIVAPSTITSSSDLLGSILNSQEELFSRNSLLSVDITGALRIQTSNNNYINVNNHQERVRETPGQNFGNNSNSSIPTNSSIYSTHHSHGDNYHLAPTSSIDSAGPSNLIVNSNSDANEQPQDYTQRTLCASIEVQDKKEENRGSKSPDAESDVDIYSDIETVSTSQCGNNDEEEIDADQSNNQSDLHSNLTNYSENDSEPDMVIDDETIQETEKTRDDPTKEEAAVTSTVSTGRETPGPASSQVWESFMEIQSEAVDSAIQPLYKNRVDMDNKEEDLDSDDGCPNFSIYSKESKTMALHTDISLSTEHLPTSRDYQFGEVSSSPNIILKDSEETNETPEDSKETPQEILETLPQEKFESGSKPTDPQLFLKAGILGGLYSDSEDESVVKKDGNSFVIADINHMTEDISEEERSYTPCLDEKTHKQGLEGLETEMISDEERNDFDESHELKTVSDGDALEINAKESELDFTRPEDYEEGEIVDKNKAQANNNKNEDSDKDKQKLKPKKDDEEVEKKLKKKEKEKLSATDKTVNKENDKVKSIKESTFKKLSKNTKDRHYREKDKDNKRSPSPSAKSHEDKENNKKGKKKEKRKELERYNVRAIIAEKPYRPQNPKDQFGRDIRKSSSRTRSRSYTPPVCKSPIETTSSPVKTGRRSTSKNRRSPSRTERSISRGFKSVSKERSRKKRRSTGRQRSASVSRSRSPQKKRSGSKTKKTKRSTSRINREKRRRKSRDRNKNKRKVRSRRRSRSATPSRRGRDWNRREWSPAISMSPSPEPRHISPSWTPPRQVDDPPTIRNESLTVFFNNTNKKKREKKRRERRNKERLDVRQRKRRHEREQTPPPSKEVFASGDNILVSVSFNNETDVRDVTTRDRRKSTEEQKKKKRRKTAKKDLSGVKPVAIIDLDRSPFKEMTPSPKDIIVLSDSDNNDNESANRNIQKGICDSSQQVASPERSLNYTMGPKTPPEPQVKFSLNVKLPQVRAITNPLHEPEDIENQETQDESNRNEGLHKGPNTPPEPPNSPPSSPDAYDPFEPTKSRSASPEPIEASQSNIGGKLDPLEARQNDLENVNPTPDVIKSLTPPIADIQPADSQSSVQATPESNLSKSPERIGVLINQTVQHSMLTKPVVQSTPFSSVPTSLITSTPISNSMAPSRINILNSTIITPPHVASSIPQRIVLPNQLKSSPVKILPTKSTIKATPIKPMPNKTKSNRKNRMQNGSNDDIDFDSPYSPDSSDCDDLFEPPTENVTKATNKNAHAAKNNAKSPQKTHQSTFDALFGSPSYKNKSDKNKFGTKKNIGGGKTKTVGVKLDEDNLKILDELPNSAVEMQVKDKFLKKLNRQERVVEEVKLVLKPHYNKKRINKEEYKDILRRSVPKICHNKSGEINPTKIKNLIEAYVKKIRHSKKVTSSSSVNHQKA